MSISTMSRIVIIGLTDLQKESLTSLFRFFAVPFEEMKSCTGEELSQNISELDKHESRPAMDNIILFTNKEFFLENACNFLVETESQLHVAVMCQGGTSFSASIQSLSIKLHKLTMPTRPSHLRKLFSNLGLFRNNSPHSRGGSLTNFRGSSSESQSQSEVEDDEEEIGETLNVLVVEDHMVNARIAKKMLEKLGCVVALADDGAKAIEYVRTHPEELHIIFMDCRMPVMDGYECSRRIRELEKNSGWMRKSRILALSAHSYELHAEKCMTSGMDGVLVKPVTLQMLTEAVEAYRTEMLDHLPN
jgi:CheY-like chemotaxis protein